MTNQTPSTAGSAFISGTATEVSQFTPSAQVIGYDASKYEASEVSDTPNVASESETLPNNESTDSKVAKQEESHKLAQLAKTERKLSQQKKDAEAVIARAEALKGAFNEQDVITALEKLGLKPNEIYRKLTDHALKISETPKTPEQLKEEANEARLKSYEDNLKKVTDDLQNERESAAHMQAINQHVAPVINGDPDRYETLIDMYGSKDAVIKEVYTQMYNEYQNTGKSYTAQEAADAMEEYWSSQMIQAMNKAKVLKKYKSYFKDEVEEKQKQEKAANNQVLTQAERFERVLSGLDKEIKPVAQETKSQPKTLTNNMNSSSVSANSSAHKYNSPMMDRNAYINNLLKKMDSK